jgi:hypothetical protein
MPVCHGCAPCIAALSAKGKHVVGVMACGGPPGNAIGAMLNSFDLWAKANEPEIVPHTIFYGPCVAKCGLCRPTMDELVKSVTSIKAEHGTHPYAPKELFAKPPK